MINDERYDSDFSLEEQEIEPQKHFTDLNFKSDNKKIRIDLKALGYDEFVLDSTGIKFYKGFEIQSMIPYKAIKEIRKNTK